MKNVTPFHLAFPVDDLEAARHFYGTVLGCPEGRSADTWIDFDLFGHQIVTHYKPHAAMAERPHHNQVDGHDVPVPHLVWYSRWIHGRHSPIDLKREGYNLSSNLIFVSRDRWVSRQQCSSLTQQETP